MKNYFVFMAIAAMFFCCGKSEKDIAGVYLKSPSVNTIDSLFISVDSLQSASVHNRKVYKYKQRFYNKKTNDLLFENESTWWINDNGNLELDNLYLDTDNNPDDYSHSKESIKNAVISSSLRLEGKKIIVDEGLKVYYLKIK
jgi:hypothetical protein